MEKQGNLEKTIYIAVGIFFFMTYFLLMKHYFEINPLSGMWNIVTFYFLLAIIIFPQSGAFLSEKWTSCWLTAKIVMPAAYVFAPIIFVWQYLSQKNKK